MKAVILFVVLMANVGCSAPRRNSGSSDVGLQARSGRLAKTAIEMLNPDSPNYDPEKGKAYLEYSIKYGSLKTVDVPSSVLLGILRDEKVASEKSKSLEQQLEILKEIDLTHKEEL